MVGQGRHHALHNVCAILSSPRLTTSFVRTNVCGCRYGPSIFSPTGALRNWSIVDELHKINAKTLVITGELEGAQRIAARPFLDGIRRVKSADIPGAAHMSHLDQPEIYYDVVSKFLDTPEEEYK